MKKIFICAPVRNRAWILPRFIQHIKNMNVENIEIETLFLINDCDDESEKLLTNAGFKVMKCDNLTTKTDNYLRGKYSFSHLSVLRNMLIEEFLKTECDYYFSVDTDILLPPDGLKKLIENKKDICSMILCNQNGAIKKSAHNIMNFNKIEQKYYHIFEWEKDSIIEVDLTGAVYLVHRNVLERGVRYGANFQGEDIPFCKEAQKLNFKIFCDTSVKPIHVMNVGVELKAKD